MCWEVGVGRSVGWRLGKASYCVVCWFLHQQINCCVFTCALRNVELHNLALPVPIIYGTNGGKLLRKCWKYNPAADKVSHTTCMPAYNMDHICKTDPEPTYECVNLNNACLRSGQRFLMLPITLSKGGPQYSKIDTF